jgi:hypothetical protein
MASIKPVVPALLVTAAFSENLSLINWGMEQMMRYLGPIALESEPFDFNQTSYYSKEMGPQLFKKLFAFADLVDPSKLADIKNMTNEIESTSHSTSLSEQPRPLNLDPGLLNLGKFMLATTKDQAHRIYLKDGIFAEVTLHFQDKEFVEWPWTYADYRTEHVKAFLKKARSFYKDKLKSLPPIEEYP